VTFEAGRAALPMLAPSREARGPMAPLDRVFVINLARRRDRAARIRDHLRAAGLAAPVELFRAVDALEINDAMLAAHGVSLFRGWKQPGSAVPFHTRDLELGEIGCSLSHWLLWRRIADEGSAQPSSSKTTRCSLRTSRRSSLPRIAIDSARHSYCYLDRATISTVTGEATSHFVMIMSRLYLTCFQAH
jgi:hypothetical protein